MSTWHGDVTLTAIRVLIPKRVGCLFVAGLLAGTGGCTDRELQGHDLPRHAVNPVVIGEKGVAEAGPETRAVPSSHSVSKYAPGSDIRARGAWAGANIEPGRPSEVATQAYEPKEVVERENALESGYKADEDLDAPEAHELDDVVYEEPDGAYVDKLEVVYQYLRAQEPLEEEDALVALDHPHPFVRAQGAWNIEPEGEKLYRLLDLLAQDPDPVVRMAALASLEEGEAYAAVKGLVDALSDPDPDVVIAAIDALEFAGDESNIRDLEPLLEHANSGVVEAAEAAIEFLSE